MATTATVRAKSVAATATRCLPQWIAPCPPLPSAVVLERLVVMEVPPVRLQQDWAIVECPSRTAYSCGEHGQQVLDGLTLYARLVTSLDLTSALYIHANDDALRGVQAAFGRGIDGPLIQIDEGHGLYAEACIEATDERFVFLTVLFRLRTDGDLKYYLVYDAPAASLSMIPCLPWNCPVAYTLKPLHTPRGGGGYELVLLARKVVPRDDVLCVWTPAATAAEEPGGIGPWRTPARRRFPKEIREPFSAEAMFTFKGKAFWVDLSQGLVYYDRATAGSSSVVDFHFIDLPPGCPPDPRLTTLRLEPSDMFPMNRDRTVGCVAGFIKFVCIDRTMRHGDVKVAVWTLDLDTEVWRKDKDFSSKYLWRLWSFKRAGLPEMEPRFPILMADGTLCLGLLLGNKPKRREDPSFDFICNLNLDSISVLWSGRLCTYHNVDEPVVLPFDFFGKLSPLVPRKRELRGFFVQK